MISILIFIVKRIKFININKSIIGNLDNGAILKSLLILGDKKKEGSNSNPPFCT